MQPMVFALTRADYENLLAELAVKNDPLSLPVRSMIFFTIVGKIRRCSIFVDAWPIYTAVACVQETGEYVGTGKSAAGHPDFAAIYAIPAALSPRRSIPSLPDKAARILSGFLGELAAQRGWHQRGVVLSALSDKLHAHVTKVFDCALPVATTVCPTKIDGALYYPSPPVKVPGEEAVGGEYFTKSDTVKMLSLGPFTMQVYRGAENVETRLDEGFHLDTLRKEDLEEVLAHCHQKADFHQPERHLRWLLKTFPSSCVRDSETGKPVSWMVTLQNGCAGLKFTLPEHRSRGFSRHVAVHAVRQHNERFATPRWKIVLPEELKAKLAGGRRASTQSDTLLTVDTKVYWCLVKPLSGDVQKREDVWTHPLSSSPI